MSQRTLSIIFGVLVLIFLLTNAFPSILILVLIFTLGLGYPLLYINTLLLYFIAALPALILLGQKPRSWPAIALTACLIPAIAILVPQLTQAAAVWRMQQHRSGDVEARLAGTPKAIELVGSHRPNYGGPNDALRNAPCEALCQRLLLSRRVDVVRVTRGEPVGPVPRAQLDYVIEQRRNCPNAFAESQTMLPQTRDAMVSGTCFVARAPNDAAMTARIVIRTTGSPDPENLAQDLAAAAGTIREIQVLEILTPDAAGWSRRIRQTQIKFSHWAMPLHLNFADCRGFCLGRPVFGRTERTLNPFDPDQIALHALRVDDAAPQERLSPAARVMALLDGAGDTLTDNQKQIIHDWAMTRPCRHGACPPITGGDETVAMRVVKDRRVTDFISVGHVFARNRRLVADNLDVFLDEMEARGANSQFSNIVGAIVAQLDSDVVRSRRDRILALIRDNEWKWSWGIGIASGRLGLDTADLISERLGKTASADTAALAACLADAPVGQALVPNLLAYLRDLPVSDQFPTNAQRDAVKALARFGHFDAAKEIYLSRFPKSGEHSLPRQSAADVVTDINACYRG